MVNVIGAIAGRQNALVRPTNMKVPSGDWNVFDGLK
jgi:hypothetical protein